MNIEKLDDNIFEKIDDSIFFKEGEIIHFSNKEDTHISVLGYRMLSGKISTTLAFSSFTERYGYFQFPIPITRRIPVDKIFGGNKFTDRELLFSSDNLLGAFLAKEQSDYDRFLFLAGKSIMITRRMFLHRHIFEFSADGKLVPVEGEYKPLLCYKFKEV